jgi:PhzF family phenazine biosynthesis protein
MYQVDAFTSVIFKGNPAAVCILEDWPDDRLLQDIAAENNLSETAFAVPAGGIFEIRWFTPEVEVDLCGHATLATAHVLFEFRDHPGTRIAFHSPRSGKLSVEKGERGLTLDFPVDVPEEIPVPEGMAEALRASPVKALKGRSDYLLIFSSQEEVKSMQPDFGKLYELGGRGVIVSAKGKIADFVSRFFAPQSGIDEDPVTGSAHTTLTPYWSAVLEKKELIAWQLSKRGGCLVCEYGGERVRITGRAVTYLSGELFLEL